MNKSYLKKQINNFFFYNDLLFEYTLKKDNQSDIRIKYEQARCDIRVNERYMNELENTFN